MKEKFCFDHIDSTQFEDFCYALLDELGYENLNWRKGTGYNSSPADNGRDIECELLRENPDGTKYFEKWFVDSKHYKRGVPPKDLEGTLSWAQSEDVDVVLFIASNFLSNPSKNYLKQYEKERKPGFRIRYWEMPDIRKLTLNKHNLLKKYDLHNSDYPFLHLIHPAHLIYISDPPTNTFDYFFELSDNLNKEIRDNVLSWGYIGMYTSDYENFKKKVYATNSLLEPFLLGSIVNFILSHLFNHGNKTKIHQTENEMKSRIEFFKKIHAENMESYNQEELEASMRAIELVEKNLKELPETIEKNYEYYIYFCDNIVSQLIEEPIINFLKGNKK